MAPRTTASDYKRHQKIVAATDMVGVPAGTRGRIMYVAGMTWIRYRIEFANGVDVGNIDGAMIMPVEEWEQREADEARAARKAENDRIAAELRANLVTPGTTPSH